MILTQAQAQAQAQAVYDAMCALNNVGGKLNADLGNFQTGGRLKVFETSIRGEVRITNGIDRIFERHDSQAAFAKAYSL